MTARQYVMVTGSSSGVGEATAKLLASRGYEVLASVRRTEDGEALAAENPERIHPVIVDLRDQETIERAAAEVDELTGEAGLAGLVNCAGILFAGPLEHFPRERWFEQYDVNLFGTAELTRAMLPSLRRAGGRVVNIGAVGGGLALPYFGAWRHRDS